MATFKIESFFITLVSLNIIFKMEKSEKALQYFRNGFNCSQAVFTPFGIEAGLSEDQCLKTACAFGGGMGRMQQTCGAVTGALMAIGLLHGKGINDPEEKKKESYAITREFFGKFSGMNGSTRCLDLLDGLNMNDPDDFQKITERKLFDTKCEKYIADAVSIIEKLAGHVS
jgi:C_GCAxxG_C_C family probable redox protein